MFDMNATNQTSPINPQNFQNEEKICNISLETSGNKTVTVTKCGYTFDKGCLNICWRNHIICPNCRAPLKERAPLQRPAQHFIRDPNNRTVLQSNDVIDNYREASSRMTLARLREQHPLTMLSGGPECPASGYGNGYQIADSRTTWRALNNNV